MLIILSCGAILRSLRSQRRGQWSSTLLCLQPCPLNLQPLARRMEWPIPPAQPKLNVMHLLDFRAGSYTGVVLEADCRLQSCWLSLC